MRGCGRGHLREHMLVMLGRLHQGVRVKRLCTGLSFVVQARTTSPRTVTDPILTVLLREEEAGTVPSAYACAFV